MPSPRARRRLAVALSVALCAAVAGGCGLGAGAAPSETQLLVSQDFGARPLALADQPKTGGSDTVMRLLQRNVKTVTLRFGGKFVQSIDGVAGGTRAGRPVDWFFYVNGLEADTGATSVRVHAGDRVWWDFHDWGVTDHVPAVVGQFPEPFLHGVDGRRLPTRVECVDQKDPACQSVQDRLVGFGLPASKGGIANSFVADTLRILVGPWRVLREDTTARLIERGPGRSGVYARPSADGRSIAVLDAAGRTTRTLGPGTGLIAATSAADNSDPVWVVTGTDARGVQAAAAALDEGALSGRFAVAVVGGRPVALPDRG
ncbi:DUF4430 domain-containing protein [Baekduia soli]|uniref:DUF4430 domain-containing protein n=1 Tax=Baekduia soli TaxID=496014 RepID=A0A5B8U764_9ACTN|nr:DUF4430 domain-containing protein [Baekduia soli]QEC48512.1 DUF4430 domain-containing protein [Baekduia soli]